MHLVHENRPCSKRVQEAGAVDCHVSRVVAYVLTQVKAVVGRVTPATCARRANRPDVGRCGPVRNEPVGIHLQPPSDQGVNLVVGCQQLVVHFAAVKG
jgi:hypothetical protein